MGHAVYLILAWARPSANFPLPMKSLSARILLAAYLPFFVWSMIGGVWTAAHYRFTFSFGLAYLGLCVISFIFKRRIGGVTVMLGIAGCQALGAFALHAWLRLPLWMSALFFAASLVLLLMLSPRMLLTRRLS